MNIWRVVLCALCASCGWSMAQAQVSPTWSQPQAPFRLYGNSYYVGTRDVAAVLITGRDGHILIDGALPDAAKHIADNICTLGFRVEDIKLILNTHVHFDHAGGIAELQRLSGAKVAASAPAAEVLKSGVAGQDDPQFGRLPPIARVAEVAVIKDGETLRVGALAVTAHATPGHTPGGTSWSWQACEAARCLQVVYADSLNPISAPGFRFGDPARRPNGAQQLEMSFNALSNLRCDVLIVPHPELVDVFGKLERRARGERDAFVDRNACRAYVQAAREKLNARLAEERAAP